MRPERFTAAPHPKGFGYDVALVTLNSHSKVIRLDPLGRRRPSRWRCSGFGSVLGSCCGGKSPKPSAPTNLTSRELWLDLDCYTNQPLTAKLSGAKIEYRLLQLYSRDAGPREARLSFSAGQGTQDLGFRSDVDILFHCHLAREITLGVRDENGKPATAAFVIRDRLSRTYPSQFKR